VRYTTCDLSGPYRLVFETNLPMATLVADPFHVVKVANTKPDECRRRVQNETLGNRGRKDDPLYRCRRLLTKAQERLDDNGEAKLTGLLEGGDPRGEVRAAWSAKELVRSIYDHENEQLAVEFVQQLGQDLQDESCPEEVTLLGPHAASMARPDRRVARGPRLERSDGGCEQPHQARGESSVRLDVVPQLQGPSAPLCGQTQLVTARHAHTPLKSEEPSRCPLAIHHVTRWWVADPLRWLCRHASLS
jgi:Transposase